AAQAPSGRMLASQNDSKLVQQLRREDQAVVEKQLVLPVLSADTGFRQHKTAHAAVVFRIVGVTHAERAGVVPGELPGQSNRELRSPMWVGHVLPSEACESIGEYDVLKIFLFAICRNKK